MSISAYRLGAQFAQHTLELRNAGGREAVVPFHHVPVTPKPTSIV